MLSLTVTFYARFSFDHCEACFYLKGSRGEEDLDEKSGGGGVGGEEGEETVLGVQCMREE